MINGKDAEAFTDAVINLMGDPASKKVKELNDEYKSNLQRATLPDMPTDPSGTARQILNESATTDEEPEPLTGNSTAAQVTSDKEDEDDSICPTCMLIVMDEGVQCDTCDRWFHYPCEKMTRDDISEASKSSSEYKCRSCTALCQGHTPCSKETDAQPSTTSTSTTRNPTTPDAHANIYVARPSPGTHGNPIIVPANALPQPVSTLMSIHSLSASTSIQSQRTPAPICVPSSHALHTPYAQPLLCPLPMTLPSSRYSQGPIPAAMSTPPLAIQNTEVASNDSPEGGTQSYASLRMAHDKLKAEFEAHKSEAGSVKKKQQAKERQLKQRETTLAAKEAEQEERNEQNILLKGQVAKLENTIKDLEQEKRLFQLKLLSSEEIRANPPTATTNLSPPVANARSEQLLDLVTASLATMVVGMQQSNNSKVSQTKIVNICYPQQQKQHKNNHRRGTNRDYRDRQVLEYDHGKSPPTQPSITPHPVQDNVQEDDKAEEEVVSTNEMSIVPTSPQEEDHSEPNPNHAASINQGINSAEASSQAASSNEPCSQDSSPAENDHKDSQAPPHFLEKGPQPRRPEKQAQ